ncbi:uncharacterized protein LOC128735350 [Sabethes cyaneus]|uniref:uncharacterized protein LOC128735350 n=1 Tax=Sabethes cyaneus TaxID=53552 RepID=UPI00237E29AC|nr:uncharacterized protein LOC128735350 [Sabethes cyaneus]
MVYTGKFNLMKEKRAALKRVRRSPSNENVLKYKQILRTFKAAHRDSYQGFYIADMQFRLKSNPKAFWKFVTSRRKSSSVPDCLCYKCVTSTDVQSSTELFAQFFENVFTEETSSITELSVDSDDVPYQLSNSCVENDICELDVNKICGASSRLFNVSQATGHFPGIWKVSHITPMHKKGAKVHMENYRGVAIPSVIPKLVESLVYSRLYDNVSSRISPAQHGFLKKKSVITNLCEFSSTVTDYISKGFQVDCKYTDMSKAFDAVDFNSILEAVKDFGIRGPLYNWVKSYLKYSV